MKKLFTLAIAMLCLACSNQDKDIAQRSDYAEYLKTAENKKVSKAIDEMNFWNKKYETAPNQPPYLLKMAAAQSQLFEATGTIENLYQSAKFTEEALKLSPINNSGILRSLARNYISQHRFQEAKSLLLEAEKLGDNRSATNKMLFDVALELGDDQLAKEKLDTIEDESDFDFLIRQAKWLDKEGDLDGAIFQLQIATNKAEELKNESLKLWAYSNIADFYGHAGLLQKSYEHYLKALEIDPNYYYSLKGIAWIAFSHDKNTAKANEILDYIMKNHEAPDYHLLKAEIAAFDQNKEEEKRQIQLFYSKLKENDYGDMYNKYLVIQDPKATMSIAKQELINRPTVESYDLYAWSLLQNNEPKKALEIVEKFIAGKTSEPEVCYHIAEIYKANGLMKKVVELKPDLLASAYELGPVTSSEIEKL